MDQLDLKEKVVQSVTGGEKGRLAMMVFEDYLDLLDLLDLPAHLERRENKAHEALLDLQAPEQWLAHLENQVLLVLLGLLDLLVLMVSLELKVKLERKVRREKEVLQGLREWRGNLDHREWQESQASKVAEELKGQLVPVVSQDSQEVLAQQVLLVQLVSLVLLELQVKRAHLGFQENLEVQAAKGSLETLDLLVALETKVNRERTDCRAQMDLRALVELQDREDLWVFLE